MDSQRCLRLTPHKRESIPPYLRSAHVDVDAIGVDARSDMYAMGQVTGVDPRVQAVVATHAATADALLQAVSRIEASNMREFGFVCIGATHRSVACCYLLAAVAYPNAEVHLTTERTQRAARMAGLWRW